MPNELTGGASARSSKPGRHAKPGRHRKAKTRSTVLGMPLAPTLSVAGTVALVAGGTAAAANAIEPGSSITAALKATPKSNLLQADLRAAAAVRADRSRADDAAQAAQAEAAAKALDARAAKARAAEDRAAKKKLATQRAAWVKKTSAAQKKLAEKVSTEVVQHTEVKLTAESVAANKKAAEEKTEGAVGATGTSLTSGGRYVLPVPQAPRRDTFGHSGAHWANRHTGTDFPARMGTNVRSVSSGTVIETGWAGAYGNRMKVLLDDGTEVWYCHLSSYVVTSGRVSAGQTVALSGSTGNSTGPHLHMEVHLNQSEVASDPLDYLRSKGLQF